MMMIYIKVECNTQYSVKVPLPVFVGFCVMDVFQRYNKAMSVHWQGSGSFCTQSQDHKPIVLPVLYHLICLLFINDQDIFSRVFRAAMLRDESGRHGACQKCFVQ